jgi:hypothetical protein
MELSARGAWRPLDDREDVSTLGIDYESHDHLGLQVASSFSRADIRRAASFGRKLLNGYFNRDGANVPAEHFWLAALAVAATDNKIRIGSPILDSQTVAIEILLTGGLRISSKPTYERDSYLNSFLAMRMSSLNTLDLAVILSAVGLNEPESFLKKPLQIRKERASLPFLFAVYQSREKVPPFTLGASTIQAMQALGPRPTKAQIDKVYDADEPIELRAGGGRLTASNYLRDAKCLSFLRGLSPELYEPAAIILYEAAALTIPFWIDEVATQTHWWPSDLRFASKDNARKGRPRFDRRDGYPVVQSADRCGLLRDLLYWLAAADARAGDLLAVHDIVTERLFSFGHWE